MRPNIRGQKGIVAVDYKLIRWMLSNDDGGLFLHVYKDLIICVLYYCFGIRHWWLVNYNPLGNS